MAEDLKTIDTLDISPFKKLVMTIGELPTSFVESMTYYEALAWMVNYLENQVIPTVNNNAEAVEELQVAFVTLKSYVDNYFDNLDVQDEINNKLDEMVEQGTLQRILNSPATSENLGGIIVGDGLQIDENGKLDVKAGSNITVNGNGVSETPYIDYIEDISVNEINYTNADGCSTYIHYSVVSSEYTPKIVCADPTDPDVLKKASEFDYIYKPTLMVNFGTYHGTEPVEAYGPLIINHEIKVENNLADGTGWYRPIMGIKDDGWLESINGSTSASLVTSKYACRCWLTLYNDGSVNPDIATTDERAPRTVLCQDYNGNYLVFVCGGRSIVDTGMNYTDIIDFVQNTLHWNAKLIFSGDGGGSSNLLLHGIRQNELVNNEDRACPIWLVWTSDTAKHEGMFRNQSINNLKSTSDIDFSEGHLFTQGMINSRYAYTGTEIASASRMYFINSRCVCYNLVIYPQADKSNGDILMDNLPYSNGNYYFLGLDNSTNTPVALSLIKDGTRKCSILKARSALTNNHGISVNLTIWCERAY